MHTPVIQIIFFIDILIVLLFLFFTRVLFFDCMEPGVLFLRESMSNLKLKEKRF